jgi:hypothetical protein
MNHKRLAFVVYIILLITIPLMTSVKLQKLSRVAQAQVVFVFSEAVITGGDSRERAVAFHAITYIDSIGHSMGELVFGTPEANNLQGEGWFANENSDEVGSFQWAGGSNKRAAMQLTIPEDVEGMLIKVNSIVDSLWMTVVIDGDTAAILLVDAYWHSGYVPIGEAVPEIQPDDEPVWFEGRYFPHFPSTDWIYVFRIPLPISDHSHGAIRRNWRIYQSHQIMMDMTLVSMQGLINRNRPRVYIEWYDPIRKETDLASSWASQMAEHVNIKRIDLDALSAIHFLMRRYPDSFDGAVIYDPDVPETINVATMYAGIENRIMLAPQQLGIPGIPSFSQDFVLDLRELVQTEGWDTSEESNYRIYEWVYDNLWPRLEHRIIGINSPGPPTSREMNSGKYYQVSLDIRDYLIALRLPALWLSPVDEPQASLFSRFLEDAPSPIPITGVFGPMEWETVRKVSEHGDLCAAINWPGGWITSGGLSVLSGVRPDIVKYQFEIDPNRILATLGNKPVVNMSSSDGDAIYYQMGHGFGPSFGWEYIQDQRFAWTTNPIMSELAPVIWNYYVNTRSEVSFISGVSGAGYTMPVFMPESKLDDYLDYTVQYLEDTGDIRIITVAAGYYMTDQVIVQYYDKLKDTKCLGFETGWKFGSRNFPFGYIDSPFPFADGDYIVNELNYPEVVEQIMSQHIEETFIDESSERHQGLVVQDAEADKGEAVFISRDLIYSDNPWALESLETNFTPGDYDVAFRLKVANNQDAGRVAKLSVETTLTAQTLNSKDISPSDFYQSNQYQSFNLSFSIDRLTREMIFRVVYDGGATDLYIDYIHAVRQGDLNMPYFACVGIDNIGGCAHNVPHLFQEAFENAGGIVLHPDEFFAALNPEYMIELATPLLGSAHPDLTEAKQQLTEGKYFTSLLTVREALRTVVNVETATPQPLDFHLSKNHPNPFNPETRILYQLPVDSDVNIKIYNTLGQEVVTLVNERKLAGNHEIIWYGRNEYGLLVSSGIYIVRIQASNFIDAKKMLLIR